MKKQSKRFRAVAAKVQPKDYTIADAVEIVKQTASAKFAEAVDIAVRLGVDPKKADQAIRGTVALPHGIGKDVRVLVIAKQERQAPIMSALRIILKRYSRAGRISMSSSRLPMSWATLESLEKFSVPAD
jgi:ribosomal protein L1